VINYPMTQSIGILLVDSVELFRVVSVVNSE
jgi:hypothetical protein